MTSRALAARRKRVLSANNRVGFGVLVLSACLSFVFAGMISYLTLYHVPVWLTWGGDQLFTHFRSITDKSVVRKIMSATNLTLLEFQNNHLALKVPVVLSASLTRCNLATMLNIMTAKRANFVSSRITSSIQGVVFIEEVETSINDFRRRSANPDVVKLGESEFFWNQNLVGIDNQFAQEWLYGCAPELMKGGKEFIDSFDANEVAGFSGSLIGRGTNFRLADRGFLNIVIEGTQHWLLVKADRVPPQGIHQNESITLWLSSVYPNVTTEFTPTEALLRPGDMIFVPEGFLFGFESTSNISTSMLKLRSHEVGEAQQLIFEATRRFNRKSFKGAENLLRKALSQDSDSYIALHQLGRVLEAEGDMDAAEEQYRRSVLKNRRTGYSFERIASIQFAKQNYKGAAATIRLASKNNALTDILISLNETVQFYLI